MDRDASGCSLCSPSRSWSPGHTAHLLGCASRPEPSQLSRRGLPSLAAPAGSDPALDSTTAPSCFLHGTFYTRWVFGLLISSSPLPDLAACDSESRRFRSPSCASAQGSAPHTLHGELRPMWTPAPPATGDLGPPGRGKPGVTSFRAGPPACGPPRAGLVTGFIPPTPFVSPSEGGGGGGVARSYSRLTVTPALNQVSLVLKVKASDLSVHPPGPHVTPFESAASGLSSRAGPPSLTATKISGHTVHDSES